MRCASFILGFISVSYLSFWSALGTKFLRLARIWTRSLAWGDAVCLFHIRFNTGFIPIPAIVPFAFQYHIGFKPDPYAYIHVRMYARIYAPWYFLQLQIQFLDVDVFSLSCVWFRTLFHTRCFAYGFIPSLASWFRTCFHTRLYS